MSRAHRLSNPAVEPVPHDRASAMVDAYLRDLADELAGPPHAGAAVVTEIGDGLLEAVGSYRASGLHGEEAARAAIAEFGEPRTVAAAFWPELGARQARRTALALIASGPLIGIAWLTGAMAASLPPIGRHMPAAWWALPVVGLALIVAVPSIMLALAATSRLGLRLTLPASVPAKAAGIASVAAVAADLTLLVMLGLFGVTRPDLVPLLPLAPAVAASAARMWLAARASRRCLAVSAALV